MQVNLEHIKVIDIDQHKYKGPEHWQEAAYQIGIQTLAWIPSRWHVYNQGVLPENVTLVATN